MERLISINECDTAQGQRDARPGVPKVLGGKWQPCLQILPQIASVISSSLDIQGRSKDWKKNSKSCKLESIGKGDL